MTEYLKGTKERLVIADEDTYGTNPGLDTDGFVIGENATIDPDPSRGYQETVSTGETSREIQKHYPGPIDNAYSLSWNPVSWRFLQSFMSHSEVDNQDGTFTHTLTVPDEIQSYTLERFRDNTQNPIVERLLGSFFKNLTIEFEAGTPGSQNNKINVSAECNAQSYTNPGTEATVSSLSKDAYFSHEAQLTIAGTDIDEIRNFTLSFDQGINENEEARFASKNTGREIGQPPVNLFRTDGSFDVNAFDATWRDKFRNEVSEELKLRIEKTSEDYFEVVLNATRITLKSQNTNFEGIEPVNIEFTPTTIKTMTVVDDESWN